MRPQKRVLVPSPAKRQLALHGLLQFRNKLIRQHQLCTDYEHKTFIDGLQYGAHLILELQ